jgi:hypothetical protein
MKQRTFISMALTIALTGCATRPPSAAWRTCPNLAVAAAPASRVASPCTRRPATFDGLPAELARVERNCGARACPQGLRNIEVKDIAQPGNALGVVSGGQTYNPSDQNGFISAAHALAQAARPPSKELISIEYIYYYLLCVGPPAAALGARATYAECGFDDSAE